VRRRWGPGAGLYYHSRPLPPVNLRVSFASAGFRSSVGRSPMPRLQGSGLQNLFSTSSKSSSRSCAILNRQSLPCSCGPGRGVVSRGNAQTSLSLARARSVRMRDPCARFRRPRGGGADGLAPEVVVGLGDWDSIRHPMGRRSELSVPGRLRDFTAFVPSSLSRVSRPFLCSDSVIPSAVFPRSLFHFCVFYPFINAFSYLQKVQGGHIE
jgi:hypothetical protein